MSDIKLEPGLDVILTLVQPEKEETQKEESDEESWLFFLMYHHIFKLYNI